MKRLIIISCVFLVACSTNEPIPGPDKQAEGSLVGAALGAGSGAAYGAQLSAGTGPGAIVGAMAGAVFGGVSGAGKDILEEDTLRRQEETRRMEEKLWAQEVLAEHYNRRLELHPNRDIFPADLFFEGGDVKLNESSKVLVREIAELSKNRMPWSRIVVTSYIASKDSESDYAKYLSKRRAESIAVALVGAGLDPHRVLAKPVIIGNPLVIDPEDSPNRYNQAIEISQID